MLPKKRQKPSSGILRAPERVYQRHRKWLRSHECVCTMAGGDGFKGDGEHSWFCQGTIEVSHIRTAANAGTALKPMDCSAVPMCQFHHAQYHRRGHDIFERAYKLDLTKLAAEFAAKTPDEKLREVLKDRTPLGLMI